MGYKTLMFCLGLCFAWQSASAASDENVDPSGEFPGVIELTPGNLNTVMDGKTHVFVEFYSPSCGHSKNIAGEIKDLGMIWNVDPNLGKKMRIVKCNVHKYPELAAKYELEGTPTINIYSRGQVPSSKNGIRYKDPRTAAVMFGFCKAFIDKSEL